MFDIETSDNAQDNDLDDFAKEFFSTNPYKKETPKEEIEAAEEPDEDEDLVEPEDEDAEQDDLEPEEDEVDEPEPEPKPKKKSVQERINELTAKAKEAERALAAEREALSRERADNARRIEDLERKINPPVEVRKPAPQETDGPTPDDKNEDGTDKYPLGQFDPAYTVDLAKYTVKVETQAAERFRQERLQQEQIAVAREAQRTKWVEQIHETSEDIPDLVEKITSVTKEFADVDPSYGQYLVDVIQSLDNGTRVLAYLSDNPGEARKIVNSGIASATVALGRLDARVARTKKVEEAPARVTKVKAAPPRTVRGNSGRFHTRGDTDDLDAFADAFFNGGR